MNASSITATDPAIILNHYGPALDGEWVELVALHGWEMYWVPPTQVRHPEAFERLIKDKALLRKFLRPRKGRWGTRSFKRYRTIGYLKSDPDELRQWVTEMSAKGYNTYFRRCTTYRVRPQSFSRAQDIRLVPSLALDIDHCDPMEALAAALAAGLPMPSMVVSTGHGVHLYWDIEPVSATTGADIVRRFVQYWMKASPLDLFDVDDKCKDVTRLLRIPGSFNFKDHESANGVTERHFSSVIIDRPDLVYSLSDVCPWMSDKQEALLRLNDVGVLAQQDQRAQHRIAVHKKIKKARQDEKKAVGEKQNDVETKRAGTTRESCPSDTIASEPSPQGIERLTVGQSREIVVALSTSSIDRTDDPDFVKHVRSVIQRHPAPRAGERNRPMAKVVADLRKTYQGAEAFTEGETVFVHDEWFTPYDGTTPIEVSRGEFLYCYQTMKWRRPKEVWIKAVMAQYRPHPLEHLVGPKGKKGDRTRQLLGFAWTACCLQDGQVQLAERTAMVVVGIGKTGASNIIDKLIRLGFIKTVYLGNRSTGRGSEFRCPLLDRLRGPGAATVASGAVPRPGAASRSHRHPNPAEALLRRLGISRSCTNAGGEIDCDLEARVGPQDHQSNSV